MTNNILKSIFCLLFLTICDLGYGQVNLEFQDKTYAENIKTVLLYPNNNDFNSPKSQLNPPVADAITTSPLVLEFDDLSNQYQNYHVKIISCNMDWKKSNLNEVEYISEYNDFIITDYRLANGTKTAYYHYRFELPKMKVSGNFLIYVYKERDKTDIVLSKRFMLYTNTIGILGKVNFSSGIAERKSKQQVDFELSYGGYQVLNPSTDFKIILRQNYRWDNLIKNLMPSYLRQGESISEYKYYNLDANFDGGNEFRFFDTRSLRSRMVWVNNIISREDGYEVKLYTDEAQNKKPFVSSDDFNGQYIIDHYENGEGSINADYAHVTFSINSQEETENELHIVGGFNNYAISTESKMEFNEAIQQYKAKYFLKQGIYNYQYVKYNPLTQKVDFNALEGTFSMTENTYEIFVYHKPLGSRNEKLVGYKVFNFNNR